MGLIITDKAIASIGGCTRLTRALVVIDAKGIIRYRKVMFRAFRPIHKSTIAAIYLAQYDNLSEQYKLKKT